MRFPCEQCGQETESPRVCVQPAALDADPARVVEVFGDLAAGDPSVLVYFCTERCFDRYLGGSSPS